MNKEQFITRLTSLLQQLPRKHRKEVILYYTSRFDYAVTYESKTEESIIKDFGTPESIAKDILLKFDIDPEYVELLISDDIESYDNINYSQNRKNLKIDKYKHLIKRDFFKKELSRIEKSLKKYSDSERMLKRFSETKKLEELDNLDRLSFITKIESIEYASSYAIYLYYKSKEISYRKKDKQEISENDVKFKKDFRNHQLKVLALILVDMMFLAGVVFALVRISVSLINNSLVLLLDFLPSAVVRVLSDDLLSFFTKFSVIIFVLAVLYLLFVLTFIITKYTYRLVELVANLHYNVFYNVKGKNIKFKRVTQTIVKTKRTEKQWRKLELRNFIYSISALFLGIVLVVSCYSDILDALVIQPTYDYKDYKDLDTNVDWDIEFKYEMSDFEIIYVDTNRLRTEVLHHEETVFTFDVDEETNTIFLQNSKQFGNDLVKKALNFNLRANEKVKIYLPTQINISSLTIKTTNGNFDLELDKYTNLTDLEIRMTDGDISISNGTLDSLRFISFDGNLELSNSTIDKVDIDVTSTKLKFDSLIVNDLNVLSTSGAVELSNITAINNIDSALTINTIFGRISLSELYLENISIRSYKSNVIIISEVDTYVYSRIRIWTSGNVTVSDNLLDTVQVIGNETLSAVEEE